ncbi:MAG TPA: YiiX/YebB-like N1pC/P60 family cysteine hydrolase, partial [Thermoanaerobaculia bacterium]
VEPVKLTPLNTWTARGRNSHYVVKRLRDASRLTPAVLRKMEKVGKRFEGKHYDLTFEWNDSRIYCSELVWKIYRDGAGIEVGKLQKLREFDLSNPAVKKKMRERYGANVPMNEPVISPRAMFDSPLLVEVARRN